MLIKIKNRIVDTHGLSILKDRGTFHENGKVKYLPVILLNYSQISYMEYFENESRRDEYYKKLIQFLKDKNLLVEF